MKLFRLRINFVGRCNHGYSTLSGNISALNFSLFPEGSEEDSWMNSRTWERYRSTRLLSALSLSWARTSVCVFDPVAIQAGSPQAPCSCMFSREKSVVPCWSSSFERSSREIFVQVVGGSTLWRKEKTLFQKFGLHVLGRNFPLKSDWNPVRGSSIRRRTFPGAVCASSFVRACVILVWKLHRKSGWHFLFVRKKKRKVWRTWSFFPPLLLSLLRIGLDWCRWCCCWRVGPSFRLWFCLHKHERACWGGCECVATTHAHMFWVAGERVGECTVGL